MKLTSRERELLLSLPTVVYNGEPRYLTWRKQTREYRRSRRLWFLGLAVADGLPPLWSAWQAASWVLKPTDLGRAERT